MNGLMSWMERYFIPIAAKIGSEKHLVAIRDAFIGIMPVTMAGSVAVLLNVLVRDLPTQYGFEQVTTFFQPLIDLNGGVWNGSLAILAFVFVFALGYQLAKAYKVNALGGGVVAFASFMIVTPMSHTIALPADLLAGLTPELVELYGGGIGTWGFWNWGYANAQGLFTALIVGFVSAWIYSILMVNKIIIKMPDSVPPAVANAFAAIIPGLAAMYAVSLVNYLLIKYMPGFTSIHDLIYANIAEPLMGLSQGLGLIVLLVFLQQIFWFFGLHGSNVLGPVFDGVYKPLLLENTTIYEQFGTEGYEKMHIWTRGSFDAYANMGGSGATITLIIAMLFFSKRAADKTVAKLSLPMGIFNINEPVVFGLPIVLNPIYFIPWILIPVVLVLVAYFATASGIVPPICIEVPWVIPPVIYAWLGTGGSFTAALLALVNLAISFCLWVPFVLVANRVEDVA